MHLVLAGILLTASLCDLRTRRIPNWLTFGAALAGTVIQYLIAGTDGLWMASTGYAIGLACFLPSYLFGALGAGDVKLMAAVGCFLGPIPTFVATLATVVAGGALAIVRIGWRGGLPALGARYGAMIWSLFYLRRPVYIGPAENEPAAERFPYAVAIAIGTLASLLWTQ